MKIIPHSWKCSLRIFALEGSNSKSGATSNLTSRTAPLLFSSVRLRIATKTRRNSSLGIRFCGSKSFIASPPPAHILASSPPQARNSEVDPVEMDPEVDPVRGFQIVVAATKGHGIGKDGTLPWKLPTDMKFFKELTTSTASLAKQNAVVMGRHTWESIPGKFRPLAGRVNVVLTRTGTISPSPPEGVVVSKSFGAAMEVLGSKPYEQQVETVFVIGGGQVYREAMASPLCKVIHLTEVDGNVDCDTFMPAVDMNTFRLWAASIPVLENGLRISFETYVRAKEALSVQSLLSKPVLEAHEEYQYLRLIDDIIKTGAVKGDRTGTGTISKFGCQMRFNLRESFPLLTTKRVFWRGVVEELLWFISGSTNAKVLHDKGVTIWDGNGSREYLDKLGLTDREEGDLGPVYGFQWRHFGAKYVDMHADYTGQGFDQLKDVIHKIKTDPDDRRIVLTAWNPDDLKLMALPPCHMFAQFYVANGELSCQMYQRSCDMGLGVPFNIASYALLTCILAHVCDLVPGDFIHVLGDAHVYKNHVEPLQEQLRNVPKPFPRVQIKTSNRDIDSFVAADFELINYNAHKQIHMKMAV